MFNLFYVLATSFPILDIYNNITIIRYYRNSRVIYTIY